MLAIVIAEAVAIVLLGVLVAGLLRSHAEILRTLHEAGLGDPDRVSAGGRPVGGRHSAGATQDLPFGVHPGMALPRDNPGVGHDIAGETPVGDAVAIKVGGVEQDTLVAFLSSGCSTCGHFWDAFAHGVTLPGRSRLVIVTKGLGEESLSALRALTPRGVPVVMSNATWEQYSIPLAPYFVYVDGPSGAVRGEGAASNWEQVDNLMRQGLADQDASRGTTIAGGPGTGDGAHREARADRELMAAGILPGDPSLYANQPPGDLPPGTTAAHDSR